MNLLNYLGQGTVTATKDTNTDTIMVYIPALFPNADGRLTANPVTKERTSVNASGEEVKSKLLHSNSVPAIWKQMGDSNRTSSPDVREGSKVAIYHVPGQNRYYWTLDGVNQDSMRLETVFYSWSANPETAENTPNSVDNNYQMKVSTHEGLIALRTSQANGEKVAFDVQINAMEGLIQIGGSEQGFFVYDELNHALTYTNADGAVFKIDKKVLTARLPDAVNIFTDTQINIKTETLRLQAKTVLADVELTQWKGRWEHSGDIAQIGQYNQEGDYIQEGDMHLTGDTVRTGDSTSSGIVRGLTDVITATISLNFHLTSGVRGGPDVSSVPIPG